ncbi:uncharacterized protein M6B38_284755 [Iris pallida]|uniref:Uncharacterized protein n=1 Tax=Iris pallida TaxID=29817 RepID=A0AAX6I2S3_IRIPA|nr:uncharacterized protein M6B38_284755 [Iris pallida]
MLQVNFGNVLLLIFCSISFANIYHNYMDASLIYCSKSPQLGQRYIVSIIFWSIYTGCCLGFCSTAPLHWKVERKQNLKILYMCLTQV